MQFDTNTLHFKIGVFFLGLLLGVILTVAIIQSVIQKPVAQAAQPDNKTAEAEIASLQLLEKNEFRAMSEWQKRGQDCEAKFQTGTIISEPRPLASLPLARGLFSIDVSTSGALAGSTPPTPVLFVPAQVQVTSRIPGVTYLWIDPQGGAVKGGPFAAQLKP